MIEGYAELGEVRLHYAEEGEGPLVVLLHGFPEAWFGWRFQIPALAAAGFRVVAPDLRGFNLSSKPRGLGLRARPRRVRHQGADRVARRGSARRRPRLGRRDRVGARHAPSRRRRPARDPQLAHPRVFRAALETATS
jgi:pimeloyl-ACP methyl ester carboxylesterase